MGFSVEDPASMEDLVPPGVPDPPRRPFPPRSFRPAIPTTRSCTTGRTATSGSLGLATAPGPADAVLVIRTPPESRHTIYDTFDDEKRVI
jgi:hypothetical protein